VVVVVIVIVVMFVVGVVPSMMLVSEHSSRFSNVGLFFPLVAG
jgi:hypothetical protein